MPHPGQPTLSTRLQWPLAALLLAMCLVLGGGQGTIGDGACQALAALLIILTLWRSETEPMARLPRFAWLAALPLAVPLLQLLPIPESLWMLPPARQQIDAQLAAAGLEPATRWTLTPYGTETALVWLLPAVALFLATLQFDAAQRLKLAAILVAVAAVATVLGIAQLAGGPDSPLRFYAMTNPTEAVGLFANRNHFASQLAVALPFVLIGAAAWWSQRRDEGHGALLWIVAGIGLAALLILGLALARSRAGLLLGMLAIACSLPAVMAFRKQRGTKRLIAVAVAVGLLLSVQFALFGILQRFQKDPMEDARFQYAALTVQAAADHAPLGTGLGGFRRAFEAYDLDSPLSVYINHAHNEYVELWLDGQWLALALSVVLLATVLVAAWRAWRRREASAREQLLARASLVALAMLAMHSIGDYPLRTTAMMATTGLLVALMARSRNPI
ncbi:O-antigen ligase family protein [Arenimonas sp.]|uniref:O-antigen ligase family protein n=1 Tax=Arenimonas sp. TaxID=1872635 RepID=UPI002E359894|nr:O-antigen ligase family protein [Arenimonas sp.]HEX4854371.1 O-antigen ligase family protein [Arenimonas sp.]